MAYQLPADAMLYPHRCTIYRPQETRSAAGKLTAVTYTAVASGVKCYFQTGQSVMAGTTTMIRGEDDNLFTFDRIHFPSTVVVRANDVLKQTTGPEANEYWRVQGNDQIRAQFAQKTAVLAARVERAPSGIS